MASSESMDDRFRLRVEKIFGSLTSSSSQQSSSLQSTLWALTDHEVERREWRRGDTAAVFDRDEIPCSSSFDELKKDRRRKLRREHEDDIDELEDDDEILRRRGEVGDEWDIRSSIGLDRTLDNEEEEDEYDKVAAGRGNDGDRLYMKNATNPDNMSAHNAIPKSLHGSKDPRANHMAARIRLREDDDEAGKLNSPHGSTDTEVKENHTKPFHETNSQLRSILKRKDNNSDSRSRKRVRFDPACKIVSKEESNEEIQAISMGSTTSDDEYTASQNIHHVPDYLRNPSKYTRYSFDSSTEVEQKSDAQASKISRSESDFEDASSYLPKSVTFIPKKKTDELQAVDSTSKDKKDGDDGNQSLQHRGVPVGIAASESQESETSVTEEDEPETNATMRSAGSQKAGRNYRIKSGSDECTP